VGAYESLYVNMPAFGLGRATGLREATGHRASAAGRLAGKDVPASTTGEVASDRA
jgi:hypothetical protein